MLLLFVLCLTMFIDFCDGDAINGTKRILYRKRRYLDFPEGSTFSVTVSNTKGLMWDVPTYGRPPWNSIMEFDLIFKLANITKYFRPHKKVIRRQDDIRFPHYHQSYIHRRERREIYQQIEDFLDLQGADGRSCIFRTLCEVKYFLKPGRSFLDDIMLILFTYHSGNNEESEDEEEGYEGPWNQGVCESWNAGCPYSLLQMIFLLNNEHQHV